jgi:ABC-2 type transport system permease protein
LRAQAAAEIRLTLQRGESVLLTLGIPAALLVFLSLVKVISIGPAPAGLGGRVAFLAPGVLALAVMSTGMVSLGIATAFERQYGVLKRLGTTPLGRPRLLAAKIIGVVAVETVQVIVLGLVALALGWHVGGRPLLAVAAIVLATVAFSGIGLAMAGRLRAEAVLAGANGAWLVLLLLGGMVFPLSDLPSGLRVVAEALPAGAFSSLLHASLGGGATSSRDWLVLGGWALAAPALAAATFRWE